MKCLAFEARRLVRAGLLGSNAPLGRDAAHGGGAAVADAGELAPLGPKSLVAAGLRMDPGLRVCHGADTEQWRSAVRARHVGRLKSKPY